MRNLRLFTVLAAALAATGCAGLLPSGSQYAGAGMATYTYQKTAAGDCSVSITSGREVPGVNATVDKDCGVSVTAEALSGQEAQKQTLSIIGGLIQRIP